MKKYRVIIWGLGNVGQVALRMCMDKESLELVGVVDADPGKVGKDAGEIFGLPKTGVIVSNDFDKVFAQDADVVLCYIPLVRDENRGFTPSALDVVKALKTKKNVISTLPISYPWSSDPKIAKMIDDAAKENGVTFMPGGLLPGWYASYIPMVIGGLMERVDHVYVASGEDDQYNNSSWVQVFGYGMKPEEFDPSFLERGIATYYQDGVFEIGAKLGWNFAEVKSSHKLYTAPVPLKTVRGDIPAGTISGHEFILSGQINGEDKVTLRYVHKICDDKAAEPKIEDCILLKGSPAELHMELKGLMTLEQSYETSAAPTVNAIPQVVAAPPGFVNALDLPVVTPIL